jgi:hypothetical protein
MGKCPLSKLSREHEAMDVRKGGSKSQKQKTKKKKKNTKKKKKKQKKGGKLPERFTQIPLVRFLITIHFLHVSNNQLLNSPLEFNFSLFISVDRGSLK